MAKYKRKIYSTQRDKLAILYAKKLKAAGIISKQAKLHGGKYISREVLAKVHEYQAQARLGYKAVPVTKSVARAAKERGYQVVQGNRVIGPATPTFRNRLKRGEITGVKPVKGGFMEEVILPHSVYDIQSLINMGSIDSLKLEEEKFAFKYKGWESYSMFATTEQMIARLREYNSIAATIRSDRPEDLQGELANITIYRLHPADERLIPSFKERQKERAAIRAREIREGTRILRNRKKTRAEKLAGYTDKRRESILAKSAEYDRARRAKMTKAEKEAYRKRAAARAKLSRERNR